MEFEDKPKVGTEFYLVDVGNRTRYGGGRQRPCFVTKVGRKYFDIEYGDECKLTVTFRLDDCCEKTEYSAGYALYDSKKQYEESRIAAKWSRVFSDAFRYGANYSLEQYEKAGEILGLKLAE